MIIDHLLAGYAMKWQHDKSHSGFLAALDRYYNLESYGDLLKLVADEPRIMILRLVVCISQYLASRLSENFGPIFYHLF